MPRQRVDRVARREADADDQRTFTVTTSCGRYGTTIAPPSTSSASPSSSSDVRAPRRRERQRASRTRAAPRAAVRLVQPQHERVRVLRALDRVEHEVRVVDRGERAVARRRRAERRVEAHAFADDAGLAPAARVRDERVRELVPSELKSTPSRTIPASRQPPACGTSAYANSCRPMSASGSGLFGERSSDTRSSLAVAAVAVLRVGQHRGAEAVLGEVGEAVARHLVARAVEASSSSASAARRSRTASRRSRSARARRAGSRPSAACAPRASRPSCGTRAAASRRRGGRPGVSRLASPSARSNATSARSGVAVDDLVRLGRRRSRARVSRWNGSMSHASKSTGPVVVELEPVARAPRASRGRSPCATTLAHRAVRRELDAQVRVLERRARRRAPRRRGSTARADAVRRRLDDAARRRSPTTSRRAKPIVFTGVAAARRADRRRRRPRPRRGRARRPRRRAGSTSRGGCRGTAAAAAASRAGRARRAGTRRRARPTRNSASCSACSQRRLPRFDARLRRVRAAVVLEVELADDDGPLAAARPRARRRTRAGVACRVRGRPCRSRARAQRLEHLARRPAAAVAVAEDEQARARVVVSSWYSRAVRSSSATVAVAVVRVGRREVREHLAAVDRPATRTCGARAC